MGHAYWKASGLPLTQEVLRELLHYDPETGIFTWLAKRPGRKPAHPLGTGASAAQTRAGNQISVDGRGYSPSRLAWLYSYGEWPNGDVYHINGNKKDDRLNNLEDSLRTHQKGGRGPLTAARLRELSEYDPETGIFYWRARSGRTAGHTKAGGVMGSWQDNGYRKICVDARTYRLHRLAWLYMTGEWPDDLVDHVNGNRGDNRWINLRAATRSKNVRNGPGWSGRKSARKGTYQGPDGRWRAQISLGTFGTPEEAHAAYMKAARLFFGEFANAGRVTSDEC